MSEDSESVAGGFWQRLGKLRSRYRKAKEDFYYYSWGDPADQSAEESAGEEASGSDSEANSNQRASTEPEVSSGQETNADKKVSADSETASPAAVSEKSEEVGAKCAASTSVANPDKPTGFIVSFVRWFYNYHRAGYFLICGLVCIFPATTLLVILPEPVDMVVAGLHVLLSVYAVDLIYFWAVRRPSRDRSRQQAGVVHVFFVAWFLPFCLTFFPEAQHLNQEKYLSYLESEVLVEDQLSAEDLELICGETGESCSDESLFEGSAADYLSFWPFGSVPPRIHGLDRFEPGQKILDLEEDEESLDDLRRRMKQKHRKSLRYLAMARDALFSSLVVLLPLEFFSLLFMRGDKGRYRRALIAAGCIDLAALFFLLEVSTEEVLVKVPIELDIRFGAIPIDAGWNGWIMLYFSLVGLVSLVSSFQAIYDSQYAEDGGDRPTRRSTSEDAGD